MNKSELSPGDIVINTYSGATGEVRGLPNGKLGCMDGYVSIRTRTRSGLNIGAYQYRTWSVPYLRWPDEKIANT